MVFTARVFVIYRPYAKKNIFVRLRVGGDNMVVQGVHRNKITKHTAWARPTQGPQVFRKRGLKRPSGSGTGLSPTFRVVSGAVLTSPDFQGMKAILRKETICTVGDARPRK